MNLKTKHNNKPKSAFSLLELSIVILIIGILLIGVVGSKHLIKKTRLASAQSLTLTSPIVSIKDNALWLETSLDYKAFSNELNLTTSNDSGNALEDGENINNWNDNSYNQNKITITAVGTGGKYANTINHIQAVKFEGSTDNYLQIDNASFLNNTDYTIFVLEKRLSNDSNNYFIGDSSITTNNQTLLLGYSTETSPIHSQGSSNNYSAAIESYNNYKDKPRLFTFTSDSQAGKKIYINGVLAKESNNTAQLSNITTLPIGKGYNGEIGEIVIFTRALKVTERQEIEDYLGKKWDNNVNRETVEDCSTGTITSTGCAPSCAVNINGVSVTSISDGATQTLTCNQAGYNGSSLGDFNCASGSLNPTPSTGDCTNLGCDVGYESINGACESKCEITGQIGIIDNTTVDSGSTSFNCNDLGATGTITYTCDNGTLGSITNNCQMPACGGGDIIDTTSVSGDVIHIFNSTGNGTLTCNEAVTAQILVVGGGGGGAAAAGNRSATGGGGGGLIYQTSYSIATGSYQVEVGAGGAGGAVNSNTNGGNGENSSFADITATGGGGGGANCQNGNAGGSGGGAGTNIDCGNLFGGTAVLGQGNNGGSNEGFTWARGGGGSGGAGSPGQGPLGNHSGGRGGNGLSINITGTPYTYSGGGGGGGGNNLNNNIPSGANGTGSGSNVFGGGATATGRNNSGQNGGSGVVIIRYTDPI